MSSSSTTRVSRESRLSASATTTSPRKSILKDSTHDNHHHHHDNRPPYATSTYGSKFGAEETLEERWSEANLDYIRRLWNLTEEQYWQLVSLKDKLADIDHWKNSPYELMRILSGPRGPTEAEELFRSMIDWRIQHKVDAILDDYQPPRILYDAFPSAILAGYDKEGDPIYLERGGVMDGYGLLQRYGPDVLQRHVIWGHELTSRGRWVEDYERTQGRPPTRLTIVYDLQGLSSAHLRPGVLPLLNECLKLTQIRYHGLAKRMIVIRAPSLFNVVWGICKYVFPKGAVKKMVFSGPHNYLEVLDKYIDREVLPPCIAPGGKGTAAIDFPPCLDGGLVPHHIPLEDEELVETYYNSNLNNNNNSIGDDASTITTSLETSSESEQGGSSSSIFVARKKAVKVRCKRIMTGYYRSMPQKSTKLAIQVCA